MIGIYLICFLVFPAVILIQVKKNEGTYVLLEKEDTNTIKGIASGFIVLIHLTNNLEADSKIIKLLMQLFSVTGGMGVLLFFFVSGYGIYKGYAHKLPDVSFLYKRLLNIYLPCLFVQFVFRLLEVWQRQSFDLKEILLESLAEAWFIYVILIQYLIFYISWRLAKNRQNVMIRFSFLFSLIVAAMFYLCGLNARWYNGLLLFPVGMTIANKEAELIVIMRRKWFLNMFVYSALFVLFGGAFTYWKGSFLFADIFKVLSGTFMSLLVCTMYTRLRLNSSIMQYVGKRSLFYYLVHLGLREVVTGFEGVDIVKTFYIVLPMTIIMVEFFYRLHDMMMRHISERGENGKNIERY